MVFSISLKNQPSCLIRSQGPNPTSPLRIAHQTARLSALGRPPSSMSSAVLCSSSSRLFASPQQVAPAQQRQMLASRSSSRRMRVSASAGTTEASCVQRVLGNALSQQSVRAWRAIGASCIVHRSRGAWKYRQLAPFRRHRHRQPLPGRVAPTQAPYQHRPLTPEPAWLLRLVAPTACLLTAPCRR